MLFRIGALVALVLLVHHVARREGWRATLVFVVYLGAAATVREWAVRRISHSIAQPVPYASNAHLGQIGGVDLVVVSGWVFTSILSFELAKAIQRRNLPDTNVYLTLCLTALVTTSISYAVEVTGTRIGLWTWGHPHPVEWLPFDWPYDAFEGWAATSFMLMLVYCAFRYRLFSENAIARFAATAGLVALFGLADLAQPWLGPSSPRKKVTVLYLIGAFVLGFRAPRRWLGSSEALLGLPARSQGES